MSIATEIQRLQQAKTAIGEAIVAKGGAVSGTIDTYAQSIANLPSGGGGGVVEGTFTLSANTTTQNVAIVDAQLVNKNIKAVSVCCDALVATPTAGGVSAINVLDTSVALNASSYRGLVLSTTTTSGTTIGYGGVNFTFDASLGSIRFTSSWSNRNLIANKLYKWRVLYGN